LWEGIALAVVVLGMRTKQFAIHYQTWLRGNNVVAVGSTETEEDANLMDVIPTIIYCVSLLMMVIMTVMMITIVIKLLVNKFTILKSATY
jgi:hypothetical protein